MPGPTAELLCFAPHPDDAELCCGGLLLKAKRSGWRVAIVDCTRGEAATRGKPALRRRETAAANRLLGTDVRLNLGLRDCRLRDDRQLRARFVAMLRRFRPRLVLAPHWEDQHPDHAAVGQAAEHAAWLCGVPRFHPGSAHGVVSPTRLPYRPELVLYYNNRYGIEPDLVVDISESFALKLALARCYASQFGPAERAPGRRREPLTRLSSDQFYRWFQALHAYYGFKIGAEYGEAYCLKGPVPVRALEALLPFQRAPRRPRN